MGLKPIYLKYFDVWKTHVELYGPKTALLYQVGGFYEIYDVENLTTGLSVCNARVIAEVCQLSLATHEVSPTEQSLFGGFPDHAVAKFERTLVAAGFTVVVVVQKKVKGTVEERVVDHISSPGCFVEGIKERRLVGCVLEGKSTYWSAAAIDVATGSTSVVEGTDRDRLHQFLCANPPTELVIWTDGLSSIADSLKNACDTVHLRCLAPASVALDEAILNKIWTQQRSLLMYVPQGRRVLAALVDFAQSHLSVKTLQEPQIWLPADEVRLGNAALEQLNVVSFKGSQSLLTIMDTCRSIGGRRLLRARLMRPISNVPLLRERIAEFAAAPTDESTDRHLRTLYDTSRLFRRIELGSATLSDLACLMKSYEASLELLRIWRPDRTLIEYLEKTLAVWNIPTLVELGREGVMVPTSKIPLKLSETLLKCFQKGQEIRQKVTALCPEGLVIEEDNGFRITGPKRRVNSVYAELHDRGEAATVVIYRTSLTLELPAITELSVSYRTWYGEWTTLWLATWSEALSRIANECILHRRIEQICAEIDVIWSVSQVATKWGWIYPEYVEADEGRIEGQHIRHPILEQIHNQVPYVGQDLTLGPTDTGLLLYGLNASGKSSLMKAVGLCTLLAQTGFPVPAKMFRVAPFKAFFTRILGNDNLWAGLSSFVVEMTEFREILQNADKFSLVLGDELCSGTESMSATAIVAAGIETLATRRTKFVFATHLHELGTLITPGVRIAHLAVHYDATNDVLVYDRTLKEGSGSALYGLEVCRSLGMPTAFLDRAMMIRNSLSGSVIPKISPYSPDAPVVSCEVCGSFKTLETHHIAHQAGFVGSNAALHSPSNLATLCATCHDDHHAGNLEISGWQETSTGRRLVWTRKTTSSLLDAEVIEFIKMERSLHRRVATIQRVTLQRFGIQVTSAQIKSCGL